MKSEEHIDQAQPETVDQHFQLILDDRDIISPEFTKVTPSDLPKWFDESLFKKGQAFYMNNLLALGTLQTSGLLAILSVPAIMEILVFTKKSSTLCLSYKRYIQTLLYIYELFRTDMLIPDSKWFKSLNMIRSKHAYGSKKRIEAKLHGIYQKDMAITQFGFLGYAFICPEQVGLAHATVEQMEGFHHFWRVTGHMLGIKDSINICRKTVAETRELCRRVNDKILVKHLDEPLPDFLQLTWNAVNGLWYADPTLNVDAFMYITYQLSGIKYKKPLRWYAKLEVKRRQWILYLCSVPYIGWVVRKLNNIFLTGLYWMLERYPIGAWLAFGKENSKIYLYSST
ncbi:unnamed protein product [Xylocopa violacea]|uniref:ER-bound oxygenase mpaB/mpaB'/Rubber oxygenase catalytic domain-containing protein n=1 Tax=Xylocopa violacea TaxID=135666 RepID=A0ABP1P0J7_XYLVO